MPASADPNYLARKKKFADLVETLGEGPIEAFCSRKWQERVEGLDTIGRMLRAKMHAKRVMGDKAGIAEHFDKVTKLVERALGDKVTPVYFATLDLLNVAIECALPDDDAVIHERLKTILPGLLKWMTVTNSRVQEKTLRLMNDMGKHERIGVGLLAPFVLKPIRRHEPEIKNRLHESRITILLALMPLSAGKHMSVDQVMPFVLPPLQDDTEEKIQNMAIALVAETYRHHGKEVRAHTRHLNADIQRRLDRKFTAIDKAAESESAKASGSTPMEDDPLWLLRIQRGGSDNKVETSAPSGSYSRSRPNSNSAASRRTPVRSGTLSGAGYRSAAGSGSGSRAGSRTGSVTESNEPKFKGHDWSTGPPVAVSGRASAGPSRSSGVDTSAFSAGPKIGESTRAYVRRSMGTEAPQSATTSDFFSEAANSRPPSGPPRHPAGPATSYSTPARESKMPEYSGYTPASSSGGYTPAVSSTSYTPATSGYSAPSPAYGGYNSSTGYKSASKPPTDSRKYDRTPGKGRSVFANTAVSTFGATSSTPATGSFLPQVGNNATSQRRGKALIASADEALMNDILNDL